MVRGGGVQRLVMVMDSQPSSHNSTAPRTTLVVPYSGWLGHILLAMRQLRQLVLTLRVGEVGPHLVESDLYALYALPHLRHLHISVETVEQAPFIALNLITSLTKLTFLSLGLVYNGMERLIAATGLSNLQHLQSLRLHNQSFSGFSQDFALNAISTKLTHLSLNAMIDGFPGIAALSQLQKLESSCWFSAGPADYAPVPPGLTSNGLTWLRCAECSYHDECSVPAYQSISRLTNLRTLMITAEAEDDFCEDEWYWDASLLAVMLQPLQQITALQLSGMEIRTLPACFSTLRLSALSLADNRLLALPPGPYLASLLFLDIRWNRFSSVPSCLVECRCLKHLLLKPDIPDPESVLLTLQSQQPGLGNLAAAQAARWELFEMGHCSMTTYGEKNEESDPRCWTRPQRSLFTVPV